MASPDPSARWPRAPASEIVSTATRIELRSPGSRSPCGVGSEMGAVLVERRLHDFGLHDLAADVDAELAACLRARRGKVASADGDVERRAQRSAAHDATRLAIADHRVTVPRKRAL